MRASAEWIQLLHKVSIFSSFPENYLNLLAKRLTLISFPAGAVLYREKDPGDSLYIIVSGSIRILKEDVNGALKSAPLAYLNRGDALGEMALLAGDPRNHTAIVDTTTDLLVLSKRDFDGILQKNPTLAVHLSRVLSRQLASINRGVSPVSKPAKIVSMVTALPIPDQVVFNVNLAISLVEQTREKVLLCILDDGNHLYAKSLGLDPNPVSEAMIRKGFLHDSGRLEQMVMIHPSGLELLTIETKGFAQTIGEVFFPLLTMIKDAYDFCLFVVPVHLNNLTQLAMNESDRVIMLCGPQTYVEEMGSLSRIEESPHPKKIEKIWLSSDPSTIPNQYSPDTRFPWDQSWVESFLQSGSPFIPSNAAAGQHVMDRLARSLGGLLIGFAMGSGAAFGYALIGMLRVMEREGIFPDVISGTSMGALIGAFYADDKSPAQLEDIALSITKKRLWAMADPIIPRSGVIKGNGVLQFLRSHLGDKTFKDLAMPFSCVATDIQTGKEVILDQGNVAEAVRASLSLPFFFQPYYLNGRYLVDGGLVNPVPTSIIVAQGANILISANLTSKASERRVPRMIGWWRRQLPRIKLGPSIPEIMMKTIYIMQYEIAAARSELSHVVMQIKTHDLLWWDLDRAKEMMDLGEASAEENISKIKSLLPFFADSCKVRLRRKGRKNY